MPTVIIPDKICSHCGGTKWVTSIQKYITKNGELKEYIIYRCYLLKKETDERFKLNNPDAIKIKSKKHNDKVKHTEEYKQKNKERAARWKAVNQQRVLDNVKLYRINNKEKVQEAAKKYRKLYRENLHSSYIKALIVDNTPLTYSDCTPELIELQRRKIELKRQLKTQLKTQKHD